MSQNNCITLRVLGALLTSLAFWLEFSKGDILWLWFIGILTIGLVLLTWPCNKK
ncbi:hypothetical protein J4233_03540 [Candidatus Pacearchaeota archaeon]|nr:hypothetical protein [Candidatus Pacearchaeota archaeon]